MKVADYTGTPTQATPFETANIGIAKSHEGQLMILNVLSSTLYSDKISAVWREIGANAVDANIEAGKADVPIKIVLPTSISPTAIIRDYGTGISREDMLGRFLWMGESTKRNSNQVTGMLGIGRMAGLAYGDSFLVVSYQKGTKITYNIYRDQGVPKLAVMHEDQTDEPDGLEIKVPVRREDIGTFAERAERTFRYFKVRPEVKGGTINWALAEPKFKGTGWAITGSGSSVAVMGNVGYAIDKYSAGASDNPALEQGAILYFDIGELEITANREGLQYKGKTIPALKAKLKILSSELAATITKTIASAPSFWDAKKAFGAAFERGGDTSYYGGSGSIAGIVSNQVTWNGIPLKSGKFKILNDLGDNNGQDPEITVTLYDKSNWRRTVRKNPDPHSIYANDKNFLVENDLPKKGPSPSRVRQYFVDHPDVTALAILTFQTDQAKDRYIKAKYMEGAPMLLLSTFPKPAPLAGTSKANGPYNSKYSAKAFVFDENAVSSNRWSNKEKCSDWWKQEIVNKKTGGVYVTIRAFEILSPSGVCVSPSRITQEVVAWKKAGLLTTPLYGFKEDKAAKLGPQWVRLADHLQNYLDVIMQEPTAKKDLADYFEAAKYDGFINQKHLALFPSNCLAANLITTRKNALSVKHNEIYGVLFAHQNSSFLKRPAMAASALNFDKLEKSVKDRYPLLEKLPRHIVLRDDTKDFKPIANYINMIENKKP
jgi:Histidine kinase-, DNA gyrase B-, and HSP90-like ATPase